MGFPFRAPLRAPLKEPLYKEPFGFVQGAEALTPQSHGFRALGLRGFGVRA